MNLSAWILLLKLKDSVEAYNIEDGSPVISGIRLLPEDRSALCDNYLYVYRMSNTLSDNRQYQGHLLTNRNDWLLVMGYETDELINTLLSIFEFYNSWELNLAKLASNPDALDTMVEISQPVFENPIAVMNAYGHMLKISDCYGPDDFDDDWKYIYEHMTVPPKNVSHAITDRNGRDVSFWTVEPQIYLNSRYGGTDLIGAVLTVDNEECGALSIYGYIRPLGEADLQLAKVFADALCHSAYFKSPEIREGLKGHVLASLLEGKDVPPESLSAVSEISDIRTPWKLAVIRNIYRSDAVQQNVLLQYARKQPIRCLPVIFNGLLVVVTSENTMDALLSSLLKAVKANSYSIGVSLPFSDMRFLAVFYNQAVFAIEQSSNTPGIFNCEKVAFERLLKLTREHNDALILSHPALARLKEYDSKNGVEFYETLYQFLINERSLKATADALFIHRNSLLYRIERIKEIIKTDLEDTRERAHILLSYLLERGVS